LLGGFHALIQDSSFEHLTNSAIATIVSSYFSESTGSSDVAIRHNTIADTNRVPKLYQTSVDGTNFYPDRNASISLFEDVSSQYNATYNEVTGIYPLFQNVEISGNHIASTNGAGIFLTGIKGARIDGNVFDGCNAVPDADPLYAYFGSQSMSAVVLSFEEQVTVTQNLTRRAPFCDARRDASSSRDLVVSP
jgi:hypothetical protein